MNDGPSPGDYSCRHKGKRLQFCCNTRVVSFVWSRRFHCLILTEHHISFTHRTQQLSKPRSVRSSKQAVLRFNNPCRRAQTLLGCWASWFQAHHQAVLFFGVWTLSMINSDWFSVEKNVHVACPWYSVTSKRCCPSEKKILFFMKKMSITRSLWMCHLNLITQLCPFLVSKVFFWKYRMNPNTAIPLFINTSKCFVVMG